MPLALANVSIPPPRHDRRRLVSSLLHHGMICGALRPLFTLALSGVAALMLTGCAGGDTEGAPTTTQTSPASIGEVKALVRTRASRSRPVQSVICSAMSEDLFFCAVTYTGPSCELWDVDGGKTIALPAIDGASGSRTAKGGVFCGQSP